MKLDQVADQLVEGQHVNLKEKVEFNEYWIAALLHDVGRMVQGFFYHDWFLRIQRTYPIDTYWIWGHEGAKTRSRKRGARFVVRLPAAVVKRT